MPLIPCHGASWLVASVWYILLNRKPGKIKAKFERWPSDAGILFLGSHKLFEFGENDQDKKAITLLFLLCFCHVL
jgi:hypothetical protein